MVTFPEMIFTGSSPSLYITSSPDGSDSVILHELWDHSKILILKQIKSISCLPH